MDHHLYVAALAAAVASAWLIANIRRPGGLIDLMSGAFASLVGGYRGDGWPVGVQEEDRDRPWGSPPATHDADEPPVEVVALKPAVRSRI